MRVGAAVYIARAWVKRKAELGVQTSEADSRAVEFIAGALAMLGRERGADNAHYLMAYAVHATRVGGSLYLEQLANTPDPIKPED